MQYCMWLHKTFTTNEQLDCLTSLCCGFIKTVSKNYFNDKSNKLQYVCNQTGHCGYFPLPHPSELTQIDSPACQQQGNS